MSVWGIRKLGPERRQLRQRRVARREMEAHERVLRHQDAAIRNIKGVRELPVCRLREGTRCEESPRRLPDVSPRLLRQGGGGGCEAAHLLVLRGLVQVRHDYFPCVWLRLVVRDGRGKVAFDRADGGFILEADGAGERASLPLLERLRSPYQVLKMLKNDSVGRLSNKRRADGLP